MSHSNTSIPRRPSHFLAKILLFTRIALASTAADAAVAGTVPEFAERMATTPAPTANSDPDANDKPTATVPAGTEVRSELLSPIDLILVTDCSRSMVGKGGPRNIFSEVKAAAKDLVDWVPPGGSFVLVAYDADVRLLPAVAIYGDRERNFARKAIDNLVASGNFTFTSQAVAESLKEAGRLHEAQLARGESPRRKLVILLTDGIDDPPPHAVGDARIVLEDVARQFGEMPWYFWQIQLGAEIDHEIDAALRPNLPNYDVVQVQDLDALRKTVLPEIAAAVSRDWNVSVEPQAFDVGTIERGSRHTMTLRFRGDANTPAAPISVHPTATSAGVVVKVAPDQIPLRNGIAEVQVSIDVDASAKVGRAEGTLALEALAPSVRLTSATVTWAATIQKPQRHVVIVSPALRFGRLAAGESRSLPVELAIEEGAEGVVRFGEYDLDGKHIVVEPSQVLVTGQKSVVVQAKLQLADDVAVGEHEGSLAVEVADGRIGLTPDRLSFSMEVAASPVVFHPREIDFGDVRVGEGAVVVLKVSTNGTGSGRVRLRTLEMPDGVVLKIVPEIVEVSSDESEVQLHLEVAKDAPVDLPAALRLVAEVVDGAVTADQTVVGVTFRPVPPWSWKPLASGSAAALVILALVAGVVRQLRLPRLHGHLRYWISSGEAFSVDLARFGTRRIRVSSQPGSEIVIADLGDSSATIAPARRDGRAYCELYPATGTSIQRNGGKASSLALHDGDEFVIRGVRFRYRGDVPARFGQK